MKDITHEIRGLEQLASAYGADSQEVEEYLKLSEDVPGLREYAKKNLPQADRDYKTALLLSTIPELH